MAIIFLSRIDDGKQVEASIATAVANITGASAEQSAVAQKYCIKIINSALNGLRVPGGEQGKAEARAMLIE